MAVAVTARWYKVVFDGQAAVHARSDVVKSVGGLIAVGALVVPGQENRFSEKSFICFLVDKLNFLNRVIHGSRQAG